MTLVIRPACFPRDSAAVRGLFVAYVESLGLDLGFQDVEAELAGLPGAYAPPSGALLLAEHDGDPVGIGAIRPLPDGTAEMKRMYVRPSARGVGAGRALALALIGAARARGHLVLRLDTLPHLTAAVALYRALGFRDVPRYNDNPLPGALFMALDLTGGGP